MEDILFQLDTWLSVTGIFRTISHEEQERLEKILCGLEKGSASEIVDIVDSGSSYGFSFLFWAHPDPEQRCDVRFVIPKPNPVVHGEWAKCLMMDIPVDIPVVSDSYRITGGRTETAYRSRGMVAVSGENIYDEYMQRITGPFLKVLERNDIPPVYPGTLLKTPMLGLREERGFVFVSETWVRPSMAGCGPLGWFPINGGCIMDYPLIKLTEAAGIRLERHPDGKMTQADWQKLATDLLHSSR